LIKQLRLSSFKGFREFVVSFNADVNVLVGPNNAGKTTIVNSMRLCAALLDHARRRNPGDSTAKTFGRYWSYSITGAAMEQAAFNDENIYHDFLRQAASVDLAFANGSSIRVEWPESDNPSPEYGFFHLTGPPRSSQRGTRLAKELFPTIGVVPTLTPVEGGERLLTAKTVRANYTTRLASSHFRNQLWGVYEEPDWASLLSFITLHTPEISDLRMERVTHNFREDYLDLYFRETRSGKERELTWAGDGLQVWLQVLFHLWRERNKECLILDEPDVYLHPDLQRRLVTVSRNLGSQIIIATHSVEVLNELGADSAIAINRALEGGVRFVGGDAIAELAGQVGSGLQLGLARALTRKVVLFVEGQDISILKLLAGRLGWVRFANEQGLAPIPMGGFSGWPNVSGFARVLNRFGGGPKIVVLLDRDYRSDVAVQAIEAEIRKDNADVHIWDRKEIENYLLNAACIARVSELPEPEVNELMLEVAAEIEKETLGKTLGRRQLDAPKSVDPTTVARAVLTEFASSWAGGGYLNLVGGKAYISHLNRKISAMKGKHISPHSLARNLQPEEIPVEVARFVQQIEAELS